MLGGNDAAAADNTAGDRPSHSPRSGHAESSRQAARADGVVDLAPPSKAEVEKLILRAGDAFPASPWIHLFAAHLRVRAPLACRLPLLAPLYYTRMLPRLDCSAPSQSIVTSSWRPCTARGDELERPALMSPFLPAAALPRSRLRGALRGRTGA